MPIPLALTRNWCRLLIYSSLVARASVVKVDVTSTASDMFPAMLVLLVALAAVRAQSNIDEDCPRRETVERYFDLAEKVDRRVGLFKWRGCVRQAKAVLEFRINKLVVCFWKYEYYAKFWEKIRSLEDCLVECNNLMCQPARKNQFDSAYVRAGDATSNGISYDPITYCSLKEVEQKLDGAATIKGISKNTTSIVGCGEEADHVLKFKEQLENLCHWNYDMITSFRSSFATLHKCITVDHQFKANTN